MFCQGLSDCIRHALYLLIVLCANLLTMCRVRFGLTGIYFDSLEPSRPREEFVQHLIVSTPPVAQSKPGNTVPKTVDSGKFQDKVMTAKDFVEHQQDGLIYPSDSSSSLLRAEAGGCLMKDARTNHEIVGSEQVWNSGSTSISSLSRSSASSPPASDEDQSQKVTSSKIDIQALKPLNDSRISRKHIQKPCKRQKFTPPERFTNPPSTKRVRFAMDLPKPVLPSQDRSSKSSSNSSDDSYTDPPSSIVPHNAFGNYHRTFFRSRGTNEQIDGWKIRTPAETEDSQDDYNGFLNSDDGSEVDVQGLSVKARPPKSVQATKGPKLDQGYHQNTPTSLTRSERFTMIMDPSQDVPGGLESSVDSGIHSEKSHVSEKRLVTSSCAGGQLRLPKLRSGKNLVEPIFVVRPRFSSHAKEERKPADSSSGSGCSRGTSKNGGGNTKTSLSHPVRVKASKEKKSLKQCPPPFDNDLMEDVEFDEDLGMLIRDV